MNTKRVVLPGLATALLCLLLAACAAPAGLPTTPTATILPQNPAQGVTVVPLRPDLEETPLMNEVPIPTPLGGFIAQMVDSARADLAQRLSVDVAQISLVAVSQVTWPDGSLGCPQPGMAYTQVQVEGMRIRLRAGDQEYAYHSGGSRPPVLCEQK